MACWLGESVAMACVDCKHSVMGTYSNESRVVDCVRQKLFQVEIVIPIAPIGE
jgi:hypothetical protein